ncbi:GNAT family N-acetyltransferase [Nitrospirillum pindoramense]|uniref:GNAT family N-acetyltransferase n=1 Tax=Nitrospirillum amazonense TaxID=28077 RepID=UPI00119F0C7B|nr:GNAT family N-acetyltransferase [Nitrospirillum amazonense]
MSAENIKKAKPKTTMIREATTGDFPEMVAGAERFNCAAGTGIDIDPASLLRSFHHLLESPDGILLVLVSDVGHVVGGAGAILYPHPFNAHHRMAQEAFVWIDPAYRGQGVALFRTLEAAAKAQGAKHVIMGATAALRPDAVGLLFKRMGYRPMGTNYSKQVGPRADTRNVTDAG